MFDVFVCRWNRALTAIAALAVGLAAATVPAVTPALATDTDLEMHATAEYNDPVSGPNVFHRIIVDNHGSAALAAGKVTIVATFPNGVRPNPKDIQKSGSLTDWHCTTTTSTLTCQNTTPFVANGYVYLRVGMIVSGPMDANVVSTVDPGHVVPESNELNNSGTTIYHFR
jgi:hypothetical protein